MENWKERFEYIYVIEENKGEKYLRKYDHTTIVEELEYFISQELSKAREEGRKEVLENELFIGDYDVKDTPEEWVCPKCDFDDCYPYKNSEDFGLMYCPACSELVKLNNKKK